MNGMKAEEEARLECERQMAAASHSRDEPISNRVGLELAIARRSQEQACQHQLDRMEGFHWASRLVSTSTTSCSDR